MNLFRCWRLCACLLLLVMQYAPGARAADAVSYTLGPKSVVQSLYPDASWLPSEYAAKYPDLAKTIEGFTLQSLQRDGVKKAKVSVSFPVVAGVEQVQVSISPASATARRYAQVHPTLLDAAHAQAALKGTKACEAQASPKCWDPQPRAGQPWAFYLPLGLPMATQRSVLFLDYPPIPALSGKDYLDNFTMCRWGRVMGAAGAKNPFAYETIVDSRPIAAPGSGEDALLPDPQAWFNSDDKGAVYLTPMLQLVTAPQDASATKTLPVAVFGSTARKTWAKMVDAHSVGILDVGETQLGGQSRITPWIATNHPDVTSYNCCPGDPHASCKGSFDLIKDEQADFVSACWLREMATPGAPTAAEAKQRCAARWVDKPSASAKQTLCIQAKLDNNNPDAACKTYSDAWNYCSAHEANACATLDCSYDKTKVKQPVPPVAKRPVGWEEDCRRYF
ncbi:hypothetical protein GCM10025771_31180 [Niveibacterium umoris]|uniref:Uncharacterized protein n=1 Tax=Niveibacterium umoris TaxID=1193620 RepID=A0A840BMH5_9RHOO|nr:hypothetical protein [Niveibacterium umoris]MBB4011687.1 hypothetical protein [Niveibacterium umoris]